MALHRCAGWLADWGGGCDWPGTWAEGRLLLLSSPPILPALACNSILLITQFILNSAQKTSIHGKERADCHCNVPHNLPILSASLACILLQLLFSNCRFVCAKIDFLQIVLCWQVCVCASCTGSVWKGVQPQVTALVCGLTPP